MFIYEYVLAKHQLPAKTSPPEPTLLSIDDDSSLEVREEDFVDVAAAINNLPSNNRALTETKAKTAEECTKGVL